MFRRVVCDSRTSVKFDVWLYNEMTMVASADDFDFAAKSTLFVVNPVMTDPIQALLFKSSKLAVVQASFGCWWWCVCVSYCSFILHSTPTPTHFGCDHGRQCGGCY
jgi:hypothetical protein